MKHTHRYGILLMIASALFFSIMGAIVKETTERLPVLEVVFFRSLVMVVILTPWMLYKKIPFRPHNAPILLLRVAAGLSALVLSFYVVTKIHLADASLLNRTSVLFVAVLSALFLKEKVTLPLVIYIITAFVGAALIIKPALDFINVPGLLGLLSGLLAAVAYVCIKHLHKTDSFYTMVFNFGAFGSLVSLAVGYRHFVLPEASDLILLVIMGASGTTAQLAMTYSFKHARASVLSPFSYATVVFSGLWGLLFWNEIPDLWSILGGVLIIASGVGIMQLKKGKFGKELAEQTENKV